MLPMPGQVAPTSGALQATLPPPLPPGPQEKITFGKFQGKTFGEVQTEDPAYCDWVRSRGMPGPELKRFAEFLRRTGGNAAAAPLLVLRGAPLSVSPPAPPEKDPEKEPVPSHPPQSKASPPPAPPLNEPLVADDLAWMISILP